MLRLHLPPNLVAAAARNAIPARVEFDPAASLDTEILPALALLQRWCGTQTPPRFIQLTRAQLRDFADAAGNQPVFVEDGKPTPWRHSDLVMEREVAPPEAASSGRDLARHSATFDANSAMPLLIDGSEHFLAISLPSKEDHRYSTLLNLMRENGFMLETSNRKWWLRDRHRTLQFLAMHGNRLRHQLGAQFTPNFERNTSKIREAAISVTIEDTAGGFDVTLGLRAGSADEASLRSAITSSRGYVETTGNIFLLDSESGGKLAKAQRALAGDAAAALSPKCTQRVTAARAAETHAIIEALSPNFQPPDSWRSRSAPLRDLTVLAPPPIPQPLVARLRPYQRLGVAWLWFLDRHELGGILADEMGLGKTLQALGLLSALKETAAAKAPGAGNPMRGTSLVVCPASLLENWRREAAHFAPQLRVFVHHADRRLATVADFAAHDLVITSYGTLARDQALFTGTGFSTVIADEAQHIKNRRSQNAAALRALRARSRFLLTGTPLENSLDDLRSLFEFLLPGYVTRLPTGGRPP
ncbi:MAG: SNF2-related protein, partial [Opitutus sp.]